jgi:galactose mutarotase-like enzyme
VTFGLHSEHLEEGYPGSLRVAVRYILTDRDELVIDYLVEPDRRTPISLTHHSYWNLGGHRHLRPVLDHELWIGATCYTPLDEHLVPTGEVVPVADTPLDFREPTSIGARIGALLDEPTRGYDHNLVLDATAASAGEPELAARLRDASSGRVMELWTTEPALQVYSGQMLPREPVKHSARAMPFAGLALEPQRFPNAVNEPTFPRSSSSQGLRIVSDRSIGSERNSPTRTHPTASSRRPGGACFVRVLTSLNTSAYTRFHAPEPGVEPAWEDGWVGAPVEEPPDDRRGGWEVA